MNFINRNYQMLMLGAYAVFIFLYIFLPLPEIHLFGMFLIYAGYSYRENMYNNLESEFADTQEKLHTCHLVAKKFMKLRFKKNGKRNGTQMYWDKIDKKEISSNEFYDYYFK